jgi:hypothetical protein
MIRTLRNSLTPVLSKGEGVKHPALSKGEEVKQWIYKRNVVKVLSKGEGKVRLFFVFIFLLKVVSCALF